MAPTLAVGKLNEFWRVLKDLNPDSIRRDIRRGFTLALLGTDEEGRAVIRRALKPADGYSVGEYLLEAGPLSKVSEQSLPPKADLFLYVVDAKGGLTGTDVAQLEQLYLLARPTVLIYVGDGCGTREGELCDASQDLGGLVTSVLAVDPAEPAVVQNKLGALLLATLPNKALAMASRLAPLRAAAAEALIAETSRVNAEFALLSNLPANVPVLGTVMGAGADFLVLTKNQAMMMLKLAAIYGHTLDNRWHLVAEMAPVVGAAFAWRTVARLLIGTLPSVVAALPKAMIAYGGTYVVGKAARFYFEHGRRPSPALEREYAREATVRWQGVLSGTGS